MSFSRFLFILCNKKVHALHSKYFVSEVEFVYQFFFRLLGGDFTAFHCKNNLSLLNLELLYLFGTEMSSDQE